jgi:hypothetical protein
MIEIVPLRDKKEKIIHKKWHGTSGQGLESSKTSTTILLTPDEQFAYFGYEAEEKYQELCNSNNVLRKISNDYE